MYKIERKPYGYKLTFGGIMTVDEMKQWVEDSKKTLEGAKGKFGVFVDMRTLGVLDPKAKAAMEDGQKLYKMKGMERSVVILASATLTFQFKNIAKSSGIYQWERYLDAKTTPNFEKVGEDWLTKAIDPDKN
jgi:hypothetical protein